MERSVAIPLDESGQLKYFRQKGSHAVEVGDQLVTEVPMSMRRLAKEETEWKIDEASLKDRALRRTGPRQVIGAVAINDKSSPYDGGLFFFEFTLPSDYPFKPPRVRMLTRCYHSGVTKQGWDPGCLDITKDNWSPALNLLRVLLSYESLIVDQNPDDPLVPEVAEQYKHRRAEFNATAREWTHRYAHGDIPFGRWTRSNHWQFPAWMRRRVLVWLLVHLRKKKEFCDMPRDVALLVCPYICTQDAYEAEQSRRKL